MSDNTVLVKELTERVEYQRRRESVSTFSMADEELMLAAASALERAAQPVGEWQSIESAPKTGRTILLGYYNVLGNWRTLRGQWFTKEMIDTDWENGDCCEAGWYETAVEPDEPNCWDTNPTHWMPLPTPPSARDEPLKPIPSDECCGETGCPVCTGPMIQPQVGKPQQREFGVCDTCGRDFPDHWPNGDCFQPTLKNEPQQGHDGVTPTNKKPA
jgi:hypothetical protein